MTEIIYKQIGGLWTPKEKGDEISGKLLDIQEDVGEYESKAYIIETENKIVTVYGSTVIDDKIKHPLFEIGCYVKIVYQGMKKGEKKDYKDYIVYKGMVKGGDENVNK